MAALGYAAISFDYRGYDLPDRLADAEQDVLDLLAFVETNAAELNVDPDRICLWSVSGGGLPAAWVSIFGDPKPICTVLISAGFAGARSEADPVAAIAAGKSQVFLAHGAQDGYATPDRFVEAATASAWTVTVETHPGRHGWESTADSEQQRIIGRVLDFVKGIGSQLVGPLTRYLASQPEPHPLLVLVDGDAFEAGNLHRQACAVAVEEGVRQLRPRRVSIGELGYEPAHEERPAESADRMRVRLSELDTQVASSERTGALLLYDEAHLLADDKARERYPLSSLLVAVGQAQRSEPRVRFVLSGLPTLSLNLKRARTYAERMFRHVVVGNLDRADAWDALAFRSPRPAARSA